MKSRMTPIRLALACVPALLLLACEPEPAQVALRAGGPHYFARADMAALPPKLSAPIEFETATAAPRAFVGYYDAEGHIESLETLETGLTATLARFTYGTDGRVLRRDTIERGGRMRVEEFDAAGKVVRTRVHALGGRESGS